VLSPANENGGGQIVVAGHTDAVARLVALVGERKGRAIPLNVSAPFHCALMQQAADRLAEALGEVQVHPLTVPVVATVDGEPNTDPSRVKELLIRQVTGRVRWEVSVRKILHMGNAAGVEVGHGKVLTGLVRRISKDLKLARAGTPGDIDVLKVQA
jgi:[acyl-carrier-protein] S-malonyltransferase